MTSEDWNGLNREERDIARRWATFNCWGWPDDLPMPPKDERYERAHAFMRKAVSQIGITKCLAYWNSTEWDRDGKLVRPKYGSASSHGIYTTNQHDRSPR